MPTTPRPLTPLLLLAPILATLDVTRDAASPETLTVGTSPCGPAVDDPAGVGREQNELVSYTGDAASR